MAGLRENPIMRKLLTTLLFAFAAAALSACGGCDAEHGKTAKTRKEPRSLIGVWEQVDGPLAGSPEREVLEFRKDGTYRVHRSGMGDESDYSVDGSVIALKGNHYSFGGVQTFEIDGDTLVITDTVPLPPNAPPNMDPLTKVTHWEFHDAAPFVATRTLNGVDVAANIPALAKTALELARERNPDVRLMSIDLEQYLPGAFKIEFYTSAPDTSGVRVTMQPYHVRVREVAQSFWGKRPVPDDFLDLPEAFDIAARNGFSGPVDRADLVSWSDDGSAHWRMYSRVGAATVNALSGEIYVGDITGYVAQYNADWENAQRLLREAFARKAAAGPFAGGCAAYEYEGFNGCETKTDYIRCQSNGGSHSECSAKVMD